MARLARRLDRIHQEGTPGNTNTLLNDADLLAAKLTEEAGELAAATEHDEVISETADVLYFTLVNAVAAEVTLEEIETELDRREQRVTRRRMAAKDSE